MDFAVSLCSSFGHSISVPPASWQAAEVAFTSEISAPKETSTPVETAILLYNGAAPSPTAATSVEEDTGKYATSDLPFPDSASVTVSTYLSSSVRLYVLFRWLFLFFLQFLSSPNTLFFLPQPSIFIFILSTRKSPVPPRTCCQPKPLTSPLFFVCQDTRYRSRRNIRLEQ